MFFFFFFNDTATTEIYTLSLHDALPICPAARRPAACGRRSLPEGRLRGRPGGLRARPHHGFAERARAVPARDSGQLGRQAGALARALWPVAPARLQGWSLHGRPGAASPLGREY